MRSDTGKTVSSFNAGFPIEDVLQLKNKYGKSRLLAFGKNKYMQWGIEEKKILMQQPLPAPAALVVANKASLSTLLASPGNAFGTSSFVK